MTDPSVPEGSSEQDGTADPRDHTPVYESDYASIRAAQRGKRLAAARRARSRRRLAALAALGLCALVLVAAGPALARIRSLRAAAVAPRLAEAEQSIADADRILIDVDDVVVGGVSPGGAEQARGLAERLGYADEMLAEAIGIADDIAAIDDAPDRDRARGVREAVLARRALIDAAPDILEKTAQASSALPLALDAWEALVAADALSIRATAAYNRGTDTGVEAARTLDASASAGLARARRGFDSAEKAFSAAPFERYLAYLDARVTAVSYSRKAEEAWLDGDLEQARAEASAANRAERDAARKAKQLPGSVEAGVARALAVRTAEPAGRYFSARLRARQADEALRGR